MSYKITQNISSTTFSDYYLPSLDELDLMRVNLYDESVGDFHYLFYWSSSEATADFAYSITFFSGSQNAQSKSTEAPRVRACRTFTDVVGAYALRDVGPGGGLIFSIDGTTYIEAAPSDQSAGVAWSNITDVAIGTTGTAVGTGQANTTAIINQAGFTDGAAKLCDDYSVEVDSVGYYKVIQNTRYYYKIT